MRASLKDILMINSKQIITYVIFVLIVMVIVGFAMTNIHFKPDVHIVKSNEHHLSGTLMKAEYDEDGSGNILDVIISTDKGDIPINEINSSLDMTLTDFYITAMNHLNFIISIDYHLVNDSLMMDSLSFGGVQ